MKFLMKEIIRQDHGYMIITVIVFVSIDHLHYYLIIVRYRLILGPVQYDGFCACINYNHFRNV